MIFGVYKGSLLGINMAHWESVYRAYSLNVLFNAIYCNHNYKIKAKQPIPRAQKSSLCSFQKVYVGLNDSYIHWEFLLDESS